MDTCRRCGTVLPTGEVGGPYCPNCGDLVRDRTLAVPLPSHQAEAAAPPQAFAAPPVDVWASNQHATAAWGDAAYGDPAAGEGATRAFTAAQPGYAPSQTAQPQATQPQMTQPLPAPRQAVLGEEYDSFFRPEPGQPAPPPMTRVMAPVDQAAAFGTEIPQQYAAGYGPPAQPAYDQPIDYQAQPAAYPEPYPDGGYPGEYADPGGPPPRSSRSAKIGVGVAAAAILVIVISLITLGGGKGSPTAAPSNNPTIEVTPQPQVPATGAATSAPTTSASSSPSAPHIPGALQFGDTGATVKWLQTRLHQLGLYNGPISGKFDQATVTAVTAFQERAHPADPAGVVGRSTKTALIAWGSRPRLTLVGPFGGDKHAKVNPDDVKRLQRALSAALNQDVKATGTFDAVMAYQSAIGQAPTGVADDQVWAALQSGRLPG